MARESQPQTESQRCQQREVGKLRTEIIKSKGHGWDQQWLLYNWRPKLPDSSLYSKKATDIDAKMDIYPFRTSLSTVW